MLEICRKVFALADPRRALCQALPAALYRDIPTSNGARRRMQQLSLSSTRKSITNEKPTTIRIRYSPRFARVNPQPHTKPVVLRQFVHASGEFPRYLVPVYPSPTPKKLPLFCRAPSSYTQQSVPKIPPRASRQLQRSSMILFTTLHR